MIGVLVSALVAIAVGFGSAAYGVYLSNQKSMESVRRQKAETDAAVRDAMLRHLRDEFEANRILFKEIKTYVAGGPPIVEILDPATVATHHLRFTAWDALVQAGVLPGLSADDQKLFHLADWWSRRAAEDVQTIAANWRRGLAWEAWNRQEREKNQLVQGIPLRDFLRQGQEQIVRAMDQALERTEPALNRIEALQPGGSFLG